jgi:GNAT superfamily N-acetyltransferase
MIRFEQARREDAEELSDAAWQAFDVNVHYGAPRPGGPSGYDSERWHRAMIRRGTYFKILDGDAIIGGVALTEMDSGHYEISRIFVIPEYQNQGIGAQAMYYAEQALPHAHRFTLGTPSWCARNQHFYEKLGYVMVGRDGAGGFRYEKRLPAGRGETGASTPPAMPGPR